MTAQAWQKLHQVKRQLSLRLFLLLNVILAVISIPWPISGYSAMHTTLLLILAITSALICWQLLNKKLPININFAALIIGVMWALHILAKDNYLDNIEVSNQVTTLMMVLWTGTISFSHNIHAFLLHGAPSTLAVMWLTSIDHWLRMIYFIALPSLGITFQHIIQRRNDQYTHHMMSKLIEEKETFSSLSMIDHLTGIYNRRGFENRLELIQARGSRNHYVLLIDIDHFKLYNDHYGHAMGDKALAYVAAAIHDAVRSRDVVSRYGGEEFLVMLTDIDCERAIQAAERIRQRVYDLQIIHKYNNGVAPNVTVSIGIAPFSGGKIEDALRQADKALYEAKHQGRNNSILRREVDDDSLKLSL